MLGPLGTINIPRVAQPPKDHLPDYEVELVIVIGKAAKDVSEAEALDYVLGYTGANDVGLLFIEPECGEALTCDRHRYHSVNTKWRYRSGDFQRALVRAFAFIAINLTLSFAAEDNTNPLGPCLVSNNAISDPQNIHLKCTLNGNVVQDGNTALVASSISLGIADISDHQRNDL